LCRLCDMIVLAMAGVLTVRTSSHPTRNVNMFQERVIYI